MRKRIVPPAKAETPVGPDDTWLDLTAIATVEVTSEDANFPIETVFGSNAEAGWRASKPGEQVVRLIFDAPIAISRILLRFRELHTERTQEFSLKCFAAADGVREISRQQWNFSPTGSTVELEDYAVKLDGVTLLELAIRPNISNDDSFATLAEWRVGSSSMPR